uniref:PET117 cytochrome c oxidase chaperone n=1 Tax=Anser cygnoides TaxID=8845 RepID=A0A8B9D8X8_ANSCY
KQRLTRVFLGFFTFLWWLTHLCANHQSRLHRGVLRDLERQHQKKENIRLLEEQIALTKQLKEERDKMLMEKGSQQS